MIMRLAEKRHNISRGFDEKHMDIYRTYELFDVDKYYTLDDEQKTIFKLVLSPFFNKHSNMSYIPGSIRNLIGVINNYKDMDKLVPIIEIVLDMYATRSVIFELCYSNVTIYDGDKLKVFKDLFIKSILKRNKPYYVLKLINNVNIALQRFFKNYSIIDECRELSKQKEYKRFRYYFKHNDEKREYNIEEVPDSVTDRVLDQNEINLIVDNFDTVFPKIKVKKNIEQCKSPYSFFSVRNYVMNIENILKRYYEVVENKQDAVSLIIEVYKLNYCEISNIYSCAIIMTPLTYCLNTTERRMVIDSLLAINNYKGDMLRTAILMSLPEDIEYISKNYLTGNKEATEKTKRLLCFSYYRKNLVVVYPVILEYYKMLFTKSKVREMLNLAQFNENMLDTYTEYGLLNRDMYNDLNDMERLFTATILNSLYNKKFEAFCNAKNIVELAYDILPKESFERCINTTFTGLSTSEKIRLLENVTWYLYVSDKEEIYRSLLGILLENVNANTHTNTIKAIIEYVDRYSGNGTIEIFEEKINSNKDLYRKVRKIKMANSLKK